MKVHILFRDLFCFAHIPCLPRSKVTASYLYPVKVIMASTGLACRHVYKTTFYSSTIYLTLSIRQLSSVRRPRLYRTEFSYRESQDEDPDDDVAHAGHGLDVLLPV